MGKCSWEGGQWGSVPGRGVSGELFHLTSDGSQWGTAPVMGSMGKCSSERVNGETFQCGGSMGKCSSEGGQWGSVPVRGVKGELFQ